MPGRGDIYVTGLPAVEPSARLVEFALREAGASVVDLGCGYGAYAQRLQMAGRNVVGVELDPAFARQARERGITTIEADAAATSFDDASFDTAILFEVLEHVPEPGTVLAEALRITRDNVLVTVPNVGEHGPLARYGVTYWHLVTEDHLNFFTRKELERLAEQHGASADVRLAEPLEPMALVPERGVWWFVLGIAARARLLRPVAYNRLYAVVRKNSA